MKGMKRETNAKCNRKSITVKIMKGPGTFIKVAVDRRDLPKRTPQEKKRDQCTEPREFRAPFIHGPPSSLTSMTVILALLAAALKPFEKGSELRRL